MCLTAPSGFSNDSKGNPTIPNGNNSFFSSNTFQAQFAFNGDGTGKVTGTYTSINPPPPDSRSAPKPSMGGGMFSYEFTTTSILDQHFSTTSKPDTNRGTVDFGPAAGQQYTIDVVNRGFVISLDRKSIAGAVDTPTVETITYSGSPNVHMPRSCMLTSSLTRMD
jgi:hypothetical protein